MSELETRKPGARDMPFSASSQDLESKEFTSHPQPPQSIPAWQSLRQPLHMLPRSLHPWQGQGKGTRVGKREGRTTPAFSTKPSPNGPQEEAPPPPERDCAPGPEVPLRRGLTWPVAAVVPVTVLWPQGFLWLRCSYAGWVNPLLSVGVLAWSSGGQIPPQG